MKRTHLIGLRLFLMFCLGLLLYNYPLLSIFSIEVSPGGFPLLYLYIFGTWLLIIVLVGLMVERR